MVCENIYIHNQSWYWTGTNDQILRILLSEDRISNLALAGQIGLPPSACLHPVQELERRGTIKGYLAALGSYRLDRGRAGSTRKRERAEPGTGNPQSIGLFRPERLGGFLERGSPADTDIAELLGAQADEMPTL